MHVPDRPFYGQPDNTSVSWCLGLPTPLCHLTFSRGVLLLGVHFSNTHHPIQSAHSQLLSLLGFHISVTETCFNHPRTRYPKLGADFMPQSLTLADSKLAYPVLPISSHGNHSNGSCPISPFHCPLTNPGASPCGPTLKAWNCLFILRTVNNKLSLQWQ